MQPSAPGHPPAPRSVAPLPVLQPLRPPAQRMRRAALALAVIAVGFSIGFGVYLRRALALFDAEAPERYARPLVFALLFLLGALVVRMVAAVCELLWLERTWSNLPAELRNVGPVEKVSSGLVIGLSFVPGISWVWKLGVVMAVADGFERVRTRVPFRAPVPRTLGMAAVIVGWVPGLNVYVAPFLWELFATRMDVVCRELLEARRQAEGLSLVPTTAP